MAARATLALKAGVWLRRGLLLIVSPVRGYHRRYQAETPLIDLFKFASPALIPSMHRRGSTSASSLTAVSLAKRRPLRNKLAPYFVSIFSRARRALAST